MSSPFPRLHRSWAPKVVLWGALWSLAAASFPAWSLSLTLPSKLYKPEWILPQQDIDASTVPVTLPRMVSPLSGLTYRFQNTARPLSEFMEIGKVRSLLVLHNGRVAFEQNEWPYDETSRQQSWSMMKGVLGLLVGIAIDEQSIASIDDPLERYAPALAQSAFAGVTFRQALIMSSGVGFVEEKDRVGVFVKAGLSRATGGWRGKSIREQVLDGALQRAQPPGKQYSYASINSQAISMALEAAVGQPLHRYLQDKLWQPLGMPDKAELLTDAKSDAFSLCCLYATPRSYAMLGQLMAQGGRWQGKQIISSRWVKNATTFADPLSWHARDVPRTGKTMNLFGFAYHWWPLEGDRGDFVTLGVMGQAIYVSPRQNVVVVRLGHDDTPGAHAEEMMALARAVADHLSPIKK